MLIMKRLREHRQSNQLPSGRDLMKKGKDDIILNNTEHTHIGETCQIKLRLTSNTVLMI